MIGAPYELSDQGIAMSAEPSTVVVLNPIEFIDVPLTSAQIESSSAERDRLERLLEKVARLGRAVEGIKVLDAREDAFREQRRELFRKQRELTENELLDLEARVPAYELAAAEEARREELEAAQVRYDVLKAEEDVAAARRAELRELKLRIRSLDTPEAAVTSDGVAVGDAS